MKIKPLVKDFIAPEYKTDNAGAFDIYLQEDIKITVGFINYINLGFAAAIPEGYVGILVPRSSIGIKGIGLRNTVGIIDSDYRGEWKACIVTDEQGKNSFGDEMSFKRGERLLQCLIVPIKKETIEIVDDLELTSRSGGFGSTGA